MSSKLSLARNLAAAFLAGPWSLEGLVERGALACGSQGKWLRLLAGRLITAYGGQSPPLDWDPLTALIARDEGFSNAFENYPDLCVRQFFWVSPSMAPAAGAPASWQIPALATPAALADWLGLDCGDLDWFADCRGQEAKVPPGPLRHYTYQWLAKSSGRSRLLEIPKRRLKAIQRRLLHDILDRIPPHEAAHGFRRGRSVKTFIAPHTGRAMVLHFDLRDFFPSIPRSRVHALFRTIGYPSSVARLLTGLCTNLVPWDAWQAAPSRGSGTREPDHRQLYRLAHLPQGAPTSPALANLCAYRLDCRLTALAQAIGACYTRYADDLAFSGDDELERCARRLQVHVCRIALEEGFEVATRKTRFMRRSIRQQLAGIVLNKHPNIRRSEYDRLRAILCNCARFGPNSQNREGHSDFRAHLAGRIAYMAMINASRSRRLQALFDRIRWDPEN